MYFFIDFENVRNSGMRGTEQLLPGDHVILFYSNVANTMESRHLEDIERSGCGFEVCKLVNSRKNALDFYIAARLGELYGGGYEGKSVVVSRDSGYKSIREYFARRVFPARRVYQAESIERGIVSADEPDARTRLIRESIRQTGIDAFFAACEEKQRRRRFLESLFSDTAYADCVDALEEMLKEDLPLKQLYPAMLHRFGRADGLAVYRIWRVAEQERKAP